MTPAPPTGTGRPTGTGPTSTGPTSTGRPTGAGRLRVEWSPGSDRLTGICHCGAQHTAEDPAEIWTWLLAHPDHADALHRGC
ncbi:hypothetical protein [Spirillospora sp. NPDC048819]|uniref:hypothetical protein n=1 Tax=Spirillospora sp. NPDC048819 TaxID=3155268 RepID=UPI0033D82A0B